MKRLILAIGILIATVAPAAAQQTTLSRDAGWILGLEKAWNQALEQKDSKALEMLLADSFVSIDIDGSVSTKSEFLASVAAPDYHAFQAVTEQSSVQVYGNAAVVVGIFRVKGTEKGKSYTHRERFVDTWIKSNDKWQCVATTSTLITTTPPAN